MMPALWGAVVGGVAIAITGFSWGGWVTGSTADKMASERASAEVVAALVPVCLEQSRRDPRMAEQLVALEEATTYDRRDIVMDYGWATMPGMDSPDRAVATACLERLAAEF
jgi:hypothetical protein